MPANATPAAHAAQRLTTTHHQSTPLAGGAPSATAKLGQVRSQLRTVARDVQIAEGRLLDFDTAEHVQRALHAACRELERITITVAALERRAR